MASLRGLSTRMVGRQRLQWATLLATLFALGIQISMVLRQPVHHEELMHSATVCLIALVTYCWVLLPVGIGALISVAALAGSIWAWIATHSILVGGDVLALVVLSAIAAVQQRERTKRLTRLDQTLDDLSEESYLKAQSLRLAGQTQEALGRKLGRYQQLQAIAEQLSRSVDLRHIADLAVSRAFSLIGKSDTCLFFLLDADRQELALTASEKRPEVPVIRSKQGDQFDRYVLRTQRPLLVNDVLRDFRFGHADAGDRTIRSVMICPVRGPQGAEGVLRLDSEQTSVYTQDDLRFMDILLDLVNAAIANARLFAQTEQLALTDGLTGLYRRQPFLDQLNRELARANRTREPLVVMVLDVDDFKRYNDSFGHTAGDVLLKAIAVVLRHTVPDDGFAARYGGEEFAVLVPKMSKAQAVTLAERIREAVAATARQAGHGAGQRVTISIGVAAFPEDAHASLELIRRADARMYHAKRAGKNRVVSDQ